MREASSVVLAARLIAEGADVAGYDPVVSHAQAAASLPRGIELCRERARRRARRRRGRDRDRVARVRGAVRATARCCAVMRTPLVIDGRNQLDPVGRRAPPGFAYEGVGRAE